MTKQALPGEQRTEVGGASALVAASGAIEPVQRASKSHDDADPDVDAARAAAPLRTSPAAEDGEHHVAHARLGDALLIDGDEAARLLSVSRATFYRLNDKGLVPAPVHLGSVRRWSRDELRRWAAAGCPPRERWEAVKR